jgi:PTH1 family peptidyl-tRNA hydrolase
VSHHHPIQLIVGLANPGKEYASTRHNAGAWFVENLIESNHTKLNVTHKFHGLHTTLTIHGHTCHILIPTTFMNRSGLAVRALMTYYKIPSEAILIAHDEIDLPAGVVKLKFDGGDSGHNGLKDIISHLNTRQFYRLRIGVSRPTHSKDVADYVLHHPSKIDRQKIDDALCIAQSAMPLMMAGEMQKAMQQIHTEPKPIIPSQE